MFVFHNFFLFNLNWNSSIFMLIARYSNYIDSWRTLIDAALKNNNVHGFVLIFFFHLDMIVYENI